MKYIAVPVITHLGNANKQHDLVCTHPHRPPTTILSLALSPAYTVESAGERYDRSAVSLGAKNVTNLMIG